MGHGKPKLCIKFEVASFSRYKNIKGEAQNFWELPLAQGRTHFSCGCDFMTVFGKPKLCTKFEVASFSRCRNIKGDPNILGSFPSPGPHPFFVLVGFDDGTWETPTKYKRHQVYSPVVMLLVVSFG